MLPLLRCLRALSIRRSHSIPRHRRRAVGALVIGQERLEDRLLLASDLFDTRTDLGSVANVTDTGSNVGFGSEPGEPEQEGEINSAWWSWTAPESGELNVNTFGSDFDTFLLVATGSAVDALNVIATNDDAPSGELQSTVTIPVEAGIEYQIAVDGFDTETGTITLNLSFLPAGLSNDAFADRVDLGSEASISAHGSNTDYSSEPGEPEQEGEINSAWWSWTAPESGLLTVDTFGSDFDTFLTVATGSSVDALTVIATNDDAPSGELQSTLTIPVEAGIGYQIAVDGYDTDTGTIALNLQFVPTFGASNDAFADRSDLGSSGSVSVNGLNVGFTSEAGEPEQSGDINSAWWSWTAPANGVLAVDTLGSSFDTYLLVATGDAVDSLTVEAENDDSSLGGLHSFLTVPVSEGIEYQIAVDGFDTETGTITLNLRFVPGVAGSNDNFADRADLGSELSISSGGTNVGFTGEAGEPEQSFTIHSAWWSWTAPADGLLVVDTVGSDFDTFLTVATGDDVAALTVLAQNDDISFFNVQSRVTFFATAGTQYQIAVDGFGGETGGILLNLNFTSTICNANNCFEDRIDLGSEVMISVTGSNVGFISEPGEPLQSGEINSAWWSWTANGNGTLVVDTFGSDFDTFLTVATGSSVDALAVLAQNDDAGFGLQSQVSIPITAGTQYQIAVDGFDSDTGNISLNITADLLEPTVIEVVGDDLLITDPDPDGKNDNLRIALDGDEYVIVDLDNQLMVDLAIGTQVGPSEVRVPVGSFTGTILIETGLGSDNLAVDTSVAAQGRQISYDAGDGLDGLDVDGAGVASLQYQSQMGAAGSVEFDGQMVQFNGVERDLRCVAVADFLEVVLATSSTLAVQDHPGADTSRLQLASDYLGLEFANPGHLQVAVTDGATIQYQGLDTGFAGSISLDAHIVNLNGPLPAGLQDLSVQADEINIQNGGVSSSGNQTYNGAVFLREDVELTGGSVELHGSVDTSPFGHPVELLVNRSFESGDFTGWLADDIDGPFLPLGVAGAGITPGFGLFVSEPTDGELAALHGFDGNGPGQIRLAQEVTIPAGLAALTFDYRAGWDLQSFCADCSLDRMLEVNIEDLAGNNLQTFPLLTAEAGTVNLDTGVVNVSLDLSDFAGSNVRLALDSIIPESFTGPAFMQIDNVSLLSSVPTDTGSNLVINSDLAGYSHIGSSIGSNRPLQSIRTTGGTTYLYGEILAEGTVDFESEVHLSSSDPQVPCQTHPRLLDAHGITFHERLVQGVCPGDLVINDQAVTQYLADVQLLSLNATSAGPQTISVTFTTDALSLRTADTGRAGDDLTIASGAVIQGDSITLAAGDRLTIQPGSSIQASADLVLQGDAEAVDRGSTVGVHGAISGGTIHLLGGDGADTFIIDDNGGASDDGGRVENLGASVSIDGGEGHNRLVLDDSGDTDGDNVVIDGGSVAGLADGGASINYASIQQLVIHAGDGHDALTIDAITGSTLTDVTLHGGDGDDAFNAMPGQAAIDIQGGSPTAPASPGDSLQIAFTPDVLPLVLVATAEGTLQAGSSQPVQWSGIESFTVNGSPFNAGDLLMQGTDGSDRVVFSAGQRDQTLIRINNVFYGPYAVTGTIVAMGGDGKDDIRLAGNLRSSAVIHGGPGQDYLAGGRHGDTLMGDDGNDFILTGEGDNVVDGGSGNDRISSRDGRDTLFGGSGNDEISGGSGDDVLDGQEGNDQLHGGGGADLLVGGLGNDFLNGYTGKDVLLGGEGNDRLLGGDGLDLLLGGTGRDVINGHQAEDVLIGGHSADEEDPAAQLAVAMEWSSSGTFAALGTLLDDFEVDGLAGGGGVDQLYLGLGDNLPVPRPNDLLIDL